MKKKNRDKSEKARKLLDQFAAEVFKNEMLIELLRKRTRTQEEQKIWKDARESIILNEEEWTAFERNLENIHFEFIKRLRNLKPTLSQNELRYLYCVKLGLSRKENAALLGVKPGSLRVTWFRIRKKLNISKNISPETFVHEMMESPE